jgi:hypothetical protein
MVKNVSVSKPHCLVHWLGGCSTTKHYRTCSYTAQPAAQVLKVWFISYIRMVGGDLKPVNQTTPTTYHILRNSPFTVSPPLVAVLSVAKQLRAAGGGCSEVKRSPTS